ncbi:unnamed protein product [Closterium sp. Yama58-4]|nr:unnamed protein product [Closterium sp. Yama58-4]
MTPSPRRPRGEIHASSAAQQVCAPGRNRCGRRMDGGGATRPTWKQTVATTRRRVVARRWKRETLLATRLSHARPRRLLHPLLALPVVFLLLLASPRALVRSRVVLSGDANLRLPTTAAASGATSGAGRADASAWPSTREGPPAGKPFSSASTAGSDSGSSLESGSAVSGRVASRAPWAASIAESLTRRVREDGEGETGGGDEDQGRTPRAGRKREAVARRAAPIVLPLQRQVRRAHSRERKTGGGGRAETGEAPRAEGGGEAGTRRRQLRGLPLDLRGSVLELGYYYVTLYLGWPPQRFVLIADTGSSITYVPCAACTHCGNHQDPRFNPSLSASYATIPCAHHRCLTRACSPTGLCTYHGVGEGSAGEAGVGEGTGGEGGGGEGEGRSQGAEQAAPDGPRLVFGCELQETGDLYLQRADGIVGLGRDALSLPNQLVRAGVMHEDEGVFMLLHAASRPSPAHRLIPLVPHATPSPPLHGATISAGGMNRLFPSATIVFGNGAALRLLPHNYLFKHKKHEDAVCLGVFDNGSGGALIGGVAVRGMRVTYDREHQRIGFAPHNCPLRPTPHAAAALSPSAAHSPQAMPQSPPHAHTPSSAASAPPRLPSADASVMPNVDLGYDSRSDDGRVGNSTEYGGEEGDESHGAGVEGEWADEEQQQWWDAVSRCVLLAGEAGSDGEGKGELASWSVREGMEGSGKVEEGGQHEEKDEEESEGSEGGGGDGSSDGGTEAVLAAPQQHPLPPAGQWPLCTHTPMSIVQQASRKYTTIRWRCTGRGGQRVLRHAEEALGGSAEGARGGLVTATDEIEADRGMVHGRAEGVGRAGADGDVGEQVSVAVSGAGVDGGEQRGAAEESGGSDGQHSHTHTHLLLHLVFSARHPPLLPPPAPSTTASSASAAPLSLAPSASTTPPLPAVLPALLPAVAVALLVRPTRVSLAAFSSSTLLLPSPAGTQGEDGHGHGGTGEGDGSEQRQRHFTTASLTIECPSPRSLHTAPARTCSHEAQRLARLVRAGRCQGMGERVQRAVRGEGAVGMVGGGDSPVLLQCSLHALPPAAASAHLPPHHDTAPAHSDSPLATPSLANASAAAQRQQAASSKGKDEEGLPREQWQAEHGHEDSLLGGAAMHSRQQQGVQEGSDVHEGSDVTVMRSITPTLREEHGASATAATGATLSTPPAVAAAVVPAVARMQEEQRLQWAALVVVYALVALCLALILRLQFRRGAFGIAIATVTAATAGGSAARPHQLCSHTPSSLHGTCSYPVAKRAVDRSQV